MALHEEWRKKPGLIAADTQSWLKVPRNGDGLHPAWAAFLKYCGELQYGEIERLKIQDGLPVLAVLTRKKIKFGS
jgi:hypothetical protein